MFTGPRLLVFGALAAIRMASPKYFINLSNDTFFIEPNDRIAQLVIAKHETAEWVEVDVLDDSERGEQGFGHTGVK